jgi:hypothetical protein
MRGFTLSLGIEGVLSFGTLAYLTIAGSLAFFQLKSLNIAMSVYDQLETVPIYQSSLVIYSMISGAIILDEKSMYTPTQLSTLFCLGLVCVLGMILLVNKQP